MFGSLGCTHSFDLSFHLSLSGPQLSSADAGVSACGEPVALQWEMSKISKRTFVVLCQ